MEDHKKQERLAREWPKLHHCTPLGEPPARWESLREFRRLPEAYEHTDAFGRVEYRHCECGSTIGVLVEIFDLSQEES